MVQDILGNVYKPIGNIHSIFWGVVATLICVVAWGYILYQGVTDPQGGIKSLWTLFGVSNQMLAGMALLLVIAVLFKMGRGKQAWVAIIPAVWVLVSTLYAGILKLLPANGEKIHDSVSHIALWQINSAKAASETNIELAEKFATIATNNLINAGLCAFFMIVTCLVLLQTIRICWKCSRGENDIPLAESPYLNASDYEGKVVAH